MLPFATRLLTILLFSWLTPTAAIETSATSNASNAARLNEVREAIEALDRELASNLTQLDEAREDQADLQRRIDELEQQQQESVQRLAQKAQQVDTLEKEVAEVRLARRALVQSLVAGSGAYFVNARQSFFKLLLSSDETEIRTRNLAIYRYLHNRQLRLSRDIDARQLDEQRLRTELTRETSELKALHDTNAARLLQLDALHREQSSKIDVVARRIEQGTTQRDSLIKDEARFAELLRRLSSQPSGADGAAPFTSLRGKLSWPVKGRVAQPRPKTPWSGVRILDAEREEVSAIASGTVVFAGGFRNLGELVIIDHGSGYMSLYANNDSIQVANGAPVETGDSIALLKKRNGALDALYFEVRHNGRPVAPDAWCTRMPR